MALRTRPWGPMTATCHIGTSGWHYPHWRGLFYPSGLASDEWLPFYARQFTTVEVNNSFYRLPDLRTVHAWAEESPRAFRFAIKASRYITHMKKLADPAHSLERFLKVVDGFGAKRGPVLFQLPPRWHRDPKRLAAFLQAPPHRLHCAFELRDQSWHDPESSVCCGAIVPPSVSGSLPDSASQYSSPRISRMCGCTGRTRPTAVATADVRSFNGHRKSDRGRTYPRCTSFSTTTNLPVLYAMPFNSRRFSMEVAETIGQLGSAPVSHRERRSCCPWGRGSCTPTRIIDARK